MDKPLVRHESRNDLAAVLAIEPEIAVAGQLYTVSILFGHAYETGIR
jgi:hypothetical protein